MFALSRTHQSLYQINIILKQSAKHASSTNMIAKSVENKSTVITHVFTRIYTSTVVVGQLFNYQVFPFSCEQNVLSVNIFDSIIYVK